MDNTASRNDMTNMTNAKILDELKTYLATHTQAQVLKDVYGDEVERIKRFDADLWKDAIENQVEIGDEALFYSDDSSPMKKYMQLFASWSYIVDDKLPWQSVEKSDFPTKFLIIENDGRCVVMSVMYGQGAVCDILPVDKFKSWMERCQNEYIFDESKVITVDYMEKVFHEVADEYESKFNYTELKRVVQQHS